MIAIQPVKAMTFARAALALAGVLATGTACEGELTTDPDGGAGADGGSVRGDASTRIDGEIDAGPIVPEDDAGPADAGPSGPIPAFVAIGHLGRSVISCDDGHTWVGDHALDERTCWSTGAETQCADASSLCWTDGPSYVECDHTPFSGTALTYGGGWFFASWGWGPPGAIRRTRDGVEWEIVRPDSTFAALAYGNDRVVALASIPFVSTDDGLGWERVDTGLYATGRGGLFAPAGGGLFVAFMDDSGRRRTRTSTDGRTWDDATDVPSECTVEMRGAIAAGEDGELLVIGARNHACVSSDGARTWTVAPITEAGTTSGPIWNGRELLVWSRGSLHRSADGRRWSAEPTTPSDVAPGPVAIDPGTGTIVGVIDGWTEWYDRQRWYRSADGVAWEVLDEDAAPRGHPIRRIQFGAVARSAVCPP